MPKRRPQPSQTWRTFLANHVRDLVALDFFTVPTARLRVLFVLVVLVHHRRRVVHFNVTEHPTAHWTAQQIVDAFPDDSAPSYLLRDPDSRSRWPPPSLRPTGRLIQLSRFATISPVLPSGCSRPTPKRSASFSGGPTHLLAAPPVYSLLAFLGLSREHRPSSTEWDEVLPKDNAAPRLDRGRHMDSPLVPSRARRTQPLVDGHQVARHRTLAPGARADTR